MADVVKLEGVIQHTSQSSITLERGQKGGYGWEIKVYGDDMAVVLDTLNRLDKALRAKYLDANEGA